MKGGRPLLPITWPRSLPSDGCKSNEIFRAWFRNGKKSEVTSPKTLERQLDEFGNVSAKTATELQLDRGYPSRAKSRAILYSYSKYFGRIVEIAALQDTPYRV